MIGIGDAPFAAEVMLQRSGASLSQRYSGFIKTGA
jgi:hypothetical protein